MSKLILTIGHSTHSLARLLTMLEQSNVNAVADVRSQPYSRLNPQFNRDSLQQAIRAAGKAYVFLGRELGARADDPECYENGKVQYARLAGTRAFRDGLSRLTDGVTRYRIAILCAEQDPLRCHRGILISRHLVDLGLQVQHILGDGRLEDHPDALARLLSEHRLTSDSLFQDRDARVAAAYEARGEEIAYVRKPHDANHRQRAGTR